MTREIKFKAWDKNRDDPKDRMSPSQTLAGWMMDSFRQAKKFGDSEKHVDDFFKKDLIFLQYTGAKDKKGVEIYEGDILFGHFENEFGSYSLMKLGVEWCDDAYAFHLKKKGHDNCWTIGTNMEVIGNIYQNPDLIK